MNSITEKIKEMPGFACAGPVSEESICAFEKNLNLRFASDYRDYLKEFGFASFSGHEWTGISDSKRLSVAEVTAAEREKDPFITEDMYVIEKTNMDDAVIWQDAAGKVFQTSAGKPPVLVCGSLKDYIERF